MNTINVMRYDEYPSELEGLSIIKEALIARAHVVEMVVKLRPGGRFSTVAYDAIKGHMVLITQQPKPLLNIIPARLVWWSG